MPRGYLVLVLHAHLPYVLSHGRWPHGMDWLSEAVCETYIPILNTIDRLAREGKRAGFTIGVTPILCEMLASDVFRSELKEYIAQKLEAAARDRQDFETRDSKEMALLAGQWQDFYGSRLSDFTLKYDQDLIAAFRRFQDEGQIEIITSAATHAYLPLLGLDTSIRAQIKLGVESYKKHFGREPKGIWLPECGYRPGYAWVSPGGDNPSPQERKGIEVFLRENNLAYFFLDAHLLRGGEAVGTYGERFAQAERPEQEGRQSLFAVPGQYAERLHGLGWSCEGAEKETGARGPEELSPCALYSVKGAPTDQPCVFFTREPDISLQVWSGQWGYPGDGDYLEFHKKHFPGGLRYWRVTDPRIDLGSKLRYDPTRAAGKVRSHALHFRTSVIHRLREYWETTGKVGLVTTPFDAELFGHWWFEGTDWLYQVASLFNEEEDVKIETASAVRERIAPTATVSLPEGSWGEGGYHFIWYNKETAWTWEQIYQAEWVMHEAVKSDYHNDQTCERILKQMARELLLLESSDWQFLISSMDARDYAESRFSGHYDDFNGLNKMLDQYKKEKVLPGGSLDTLARIERRDDIFKGINLEWFEERTEHGL